MAVLIVGVELHSAEGEELLQQEGIASWYGEAHRGKLMANGEPFDPSRLTAASWFYPLGTFLKVSVTNSAGVSRTVTVRVCDRGPAQRFVRRGRIIDLSYEAFKALAPPDVGLVRVKVDPVAVSEPLAMRPG